MNLFKRKPSRQYLIKTSVQYLLNEGILDRCERFKVRLDNHQERIEALEFHLGEINNFSETLEKRIKALEERDNFFFRRD